MVFLDYQGLKTFKNCIDNNFLPAIDCCVQRSAAFTVELQNPTLDFAFPTSTYEPGVEFKDKK